MKTNNGFLSIMAELFYSVVFLYIGAWIWGSHVEIKSFGVALMVVILLVFLNRYLKPFLILLGIPLLIFTLGLGYMLITGTIIFICSKLVPSFYIQNFWYAVLLSVTMGILEMITYFILSLFVKEEE